jgi:site-specific DNA recombinase
MSITLRRAHRDVLYAAVVADLSGVGDIYAALSQGDVEEAAAAHDDSERDEIEMRRAGIAAEIKRAERAIERYYSAFEAGDLDAKRFDGRIAALQSQLDTLTDQHDELTHQLADDASQEPPDTRQLRAVADHLEETLKAARPEETKALLRLLIEDLQVNSRAEILPKYKVAAQMVCAATCEVELVGLEPTTFALPARRSPS